VAAIAELFQQRKFVTATAVILSEAKDLTKTQWTIARSLASLGMTDRFNVYEP
jgi:hypothetical protein